MKKYNLLVLLAFALFACSPVKRLERLQKRHSYLFTNLTDTLTVSDTIRLTIPGTQIDTAVHASMLRDTITIFKDGVQTIVWQKGDTVFVNTKTDTIFKVVPFEKDIIVKKYVLPLPRDKLKEFLMKCAFLLSFVAILLAITFRISRKL